jgi:hypothetical protein
VPIDQPSSRWSSLTKGSGQQNCEELSLQATSFSQDNLKLKLRCRVYSLGLIKVIPHFAHPEAGSCETNSSAGI